MAGSNENLSFTASYFTLKQNYFHQRMLGIVFRNLNYHACIDFTLKKIVVLM